MRSETASPPADDGAELVVASQADPAAFAVLYDRQVDSIYRFCLRRLGCVEDAEDATAQVFTKALAALPGFRGGSVQGWLFAIAARVVLDAQRARHTHSPLVDADAVVDSRPGPEDSALIADTAQRIRGLLAQLPPDQRVVVEMRLAGLTGVEIAQALGRSHGTIRNVQHRTLARLRAMLAVAGTSERRGDVHVE